MGSWNATCGISKMPIRCGDKVVDFFIGEVGSFRDSGFICYPNDLWAPVTIQTYGTYADYGRIEADSGWHVDYVSSMLKRHSVKVEQGDNEYHDVAVDPASIDFDTAQDLIQDGRLFFEVPRGQWDIISDRNTKSPLVANKYSRITRMMVARQVFDEIVSWGIHGRRVSSTPLEMYIDAGMKAVADYNKTDGSLIEQELRRLRLIHGNRKNIFEEEFVGSESGDYYVPHKFSSYLPYAMDSDPSNTLAIITELSKFIIFRENIGELQFLWTPQTGSQNHSRHKLMTLNLFCNDLMRAQLKEEEEYDMEDGGTEDG